MLRLAPSIDQARRFHPFAFHVRRTEAQAIRRPQKMGRDWSLRRSSGNTAEKMSGVCAMVQVRSLFPTPFLHSRLDCPQEALTALQRAFSQLAEQPNNRSDQLLHSQSGDPSSIPAFEPVHRALEKPLAGFGNVLLGEVVPWRIKEVWINRLEPGGSQAMHAHANSVISGVLYLTDSHESAHLVFHRTPPGGFILSNAHLGAELNIYNAERQQVGPTKAGDLILFPSHLLHSVPVNRGAPRISVAFNAVPERVNAWGYELRLS